MRLIGAERDVVGDVVEPVLLRLPGRGRDVDGPADQRRIDVDRTDLRLQLLQISERQHLREVRRRFEGT
jgi:hypothetical protein